MEKQGPERGSGAFMPDVDVKIDIRHFSFQRNSRIFGVSFQYGVR
jgi:hypothetical protein